MSANDISLLLKDRESEYLRERRSVDRKLFLRPIEIAIGPARRDITKAFSRDISTQGIGTMSEREFVDYTRARVTVHLSNRKKIEVDAEARWTQTFGSRWFITGWSFLS